MKNNQAELTQSRKQQVSLPGAVLHCVYVILSILCPFRFPAHRFHLWHIMEAPNDI